MYGLVNRGLKEFVERSFGEELWQQVAAAQGIGDLEFEDLRAYPDELTYGIVGTISEASKIDAGDLLRRFGRFWVLFTGQSAYAEYFDQCDALCDFVSSLDIIHAALAEQMPKLRPPSFGAEETSEGWMISYVSEREGLEPMVVGLLEGLVEFFAVDREVIQLSDSNHGEAQFLITPRRA